MFTDVNACGADLPWSTMILANAIAIAIAGQHVARNNKKHMFRGSVCRVRLHFQTCSPGERDSRATTIQLQTTSTLSTSKSCISGSEN
jgi:hypothetical protein